VGSPRRAANVALGSTIALCALALVYPGPQLFTDRIEPYVFGLPFGLAWMIAWCVVAFLALAGYHLSSDDR